jgi:hypothetical protein
VCADAGEPPQRRTQIIAKPYLCFAACCQVVVHEISGRDIDQVTIANHLGIALPTDRECSDLTEAGVINIRVDADPDRWGITPTPAEVEAVLKRAGDLECRFEGIS